MIYLNMLQNLGRSPICPTFDQDDYNMTSYKGKRKGKGGGKKISSKEMGGKGIVLLKSGTDWASSNLVVLEPS